MKHKDTKFKTMKIMGVATVMVASAVSPVAFSALSGSAYAVSASTANVTANNEVYESEIEAITELMIRFQEDGSYALARALYAYYGIADHYFELARITYNTASDKYNPNTLYGWVIDFLTSVKVKDTNDTLVTYYNKMPNDVKELVKQEVNAVGMEVTDYLHKWHFAVTVIEVLESMLKYGATNNFSDDVMNMTHDLYDVYYNVKQMFANVTMAEDLGDFRNMSVLDFFKSVEGKIGSEVTNKHPYWQHSDELAWKIYYFYGSFLQPLNSSRVELDYLVRRGNYYEGTPYVYHDGLDARLERYRTTALSMEYFVSPGNPAHGIQIILTGILKDLWDVINEARALPNYDRFTSLYVLINEPQAYVDNERVKKVILDIDPTVKVDDLDGVKVDALTVAKRLPNFEEYWELVKDMRVFDNYGAVESTGEVPLFRSNYAMYTDEFAQEIIDKTAKIRSDLEKFDENTLPKAPNAGELNKRDTAGADIVENLMVAGVMIAGSLGVGYTVKRYLFSPLKRKK